MPARGIAQNIPSSINIQSSARSKTSFNQNPKPVSLKVFVVSTFQVFIINSLSHLLSDATLHPNSIYFPLHQFFVVGSVLFPWHAITEHPAIIILHKALKLKSRIYFYDGGLRPCCFDILCSKLELLSCHFWTSIRFSKQLQKVLSPQVMTISVKNVNRSSTHTD